MSEIVQHARPEGDTAGEVLNDDPAAMERRIFRGMCATVALAVPLSAALGAPWRVTTGLLLGGVLSLFSHHWLRTSVAAAFGAEISGAKPKLKIARYVLRYFVMAAAVAAAYVLDLVSLAATIAGMCSFVVASIAEGLMQLYFALVKREES